MRNLVAVLILLAALVAVPGCGSSTPSSPTTPPNQTPAVSACGAVNAQRIAGLSILNGSDCQSGTSPVVLFRSTDNADNQYICTGTVIAQRAVITAKHCLVGADGAPMKKVAVSYGTVAAPNSSSYQLAPAGVDIAVVLFADNFPQTPVPLLVSRDPQQGETAVIAGYGQTQSGTGAGTILRAGTTTISAVTTDTITTQYTGATSGASGVCYGDSGGPLLVSQGGAWALAGVTSYLSGSNSCTATSNNFMNVKNPTVQAFIASAVSGLPAGK